MPDSLVITPLLVPRTITDADSADFVEFTALENLCWEAALGAADFAHEPGEALPDWRIPKRFREGVVARLGGRMVGAATYSGDAGQGDTEANVLVHPEFRRRGIGSALFDRVIERARAAGRLTLQGHVFDGPDLMGERPDLPGARVDAASGSGSIAAANAGLAFALARGASLEQVGRVSRLGLPIDPRTALECDAIARRGYYGQYELLRWEGFTPDEFLDDIAVLMTRMSTDAPSAGLERAEDLWDAERLRAMEREFAASPRHLLVVAARELATGRLVGYTQLNVPAEAGRPVDQWATLVLTEHRGHRLGLALKLENLLYLEETSPGHASVMTINASENSPMLDVNVVVGFTPIGVEGSVQLTLPA